FEKAGLDPETPPATWADLEEYASALEEKDGDKWKTIGFYPLWSTGEDVWRRAPDATSASLTNMNPSAITARGWQNTGFARNSRWSVSAKRPPWGLVTPITNCSSISSFARSVLLKKKKEYSPRSTRKANLCRR